MRFMYAAMFNAKDNEAMVKFFKEAVVPALDEMVADGTMTGYGIQSREIHVDADWTHRFWYGLPDLAVDVDDDEIRGTLELDTQAEDVPAAPPYLR